MTCGKFCQTKMLPDTPDTPHSPDVAHKPTKIGPDD